MKSVSDSNPVLVEIMLSVSENYLKVCCTTHIFVLCGDILPSAEHDWLK